MSINQIIKPFLLIILFFSIKNLAAQKLDGIYNLHSAGKQSVLSSYGDNNYIKFTGDRFILFNLKNSELTKHESPYNEVYQVGMGTYELTNRKLVLYFKYDSNIIRHYIPDSVSCSFSSDTASSVTLIFVELDKRNTGSKPSLEIETSLNRGNIYYFKNGNVVASIPSNVAVKSISIADIEFEKRVLPYDYHFNNLKYYYRLNYEDALSYIIDNKVLEFNIKSIKDGFYRFEHNSSLQKIDKRQLDYFKSIKYKNERVKEILMKMGIN